jgi:hypothetical protein
MGAFSKGSTEKQIRSFYSFGICGRTSGQDTARFGIQNWQKTWDGQQDAYAYGQNLTEAEQARLINKCG